MSLIIFKISLICLIVTFILSFIVSQRQIDHLSDKFNSVTSEEFENNILEDILLSSMMMLFLLTCISAYYSFFNF